MSGAFDIPKRFLKGSYDQNAYFHSLLDYLPNLHGWRTSRVPSRYPTFLTFGRVSATIGLVAADGRQVFQVMENKWRAARCGSMAS